MSASLNEMPRKRRGGGRRTCDTLEKHAPADTFAGHCPVVTHGHLASDGIGQCHSGIRELAADPDFSADRIGVVPHAAVVSSDGGLKTAIDLIVMRHREYRGLQQARGDWDRRIKGVERWATCSRLNVWPRGKTAKFPTPDDADKQKVREIYPRWFDARKQVHALQAECLKELLGYVPFLPQSATHFMATTKGFAAPSLLAIVAHAGDLSNYSNPAKLWKRFSLHCTDGRAARRVKGDATQEFVPVRRAEMHVIGDCLLRAADEYATLYRERKQHEIAKAHALGLEVRSAARIPKKDADRFISDGHIHKRALRYIEKRLLRELWRAWRGASLAVSPSKVVLPAEHVGGPRPCDTQGDAATNGDEGPTKACHPVRRCPSSSPIKRKRQRVPRETKH